MNRLYAKTRRARTRTFKLPEASWKLTTAFAVVAAVSLFGYIAGVSSASAKNYQIGALRQQVAALQDERTRDEFAMAQAESVQAIEAKVQTLGMVPADQVDYLTPAAAPAIARR